MTTSPENKPKLKLSPAERALGARLVVSQESDTTAATSSQQNDLTVPPRGKQGPNIPPPLRVAQNHQVSPFVRKTFDQWYEVVDQLSADSTTVTYKAVDVSTKQPLRITVLLPYFIEKTRSEQVVQHRLQLAQALTHESIVPVRSIGINDEGQTYIVEDYREGITLRDLLTQARYVAPKTAIDIFTQVCDGLEYAHSRGVVHGSLSPDDILLWSNNNGGYDAQIRNFAIDALIPTRDEDVQRLTGCGVLLGSDMAEYLSPEQCMGNQPDARSDIFALGTIMYEALAGRKAVEAETFVQALSRQINEMPPSLADVCFERQIPEAFEAVIFKCLQRKPDERYQRASQLKLALMLPQVVSGKPRPRVTSTDPARHSVDSDRSQMRNIALVSGGVLALLLALATIFIWMPHRADISDSDDAPPAPTVPLQVPGVTSPPTDGDPDATQLNDKSHEIQGRISELTAILASHPSDINALLARAQAYFEAHDYPHAIADLVARSKIHEDKWHGESDSTAALKLRVESLTASGKRDEALQLCNQIVKSSPKDVPALILRAGVLVDRGFPNDALKDADRALALNKDNAEAYLSKAHAANAANMGAEAMAAADTAMQLTSADNIPAMMERASALMHLGRLQEAEAQALKIFEIDNELPAAYNLLGNIYLAQRRYSDAAYEFGTATGLDSYALEGYLGAGQADLKQAKYADAILEGNKVLKLDQTNAEADQLLFEAYKLSGDSQKATEYKTKAQQSLERP